MCEAKARAIVACGVESWEFQGVLAQLFALLPHCFLPFGTRRFCIAGQYLQLALLS